MVDFTDIINKASVLYGENTEFELIVKYDGDVLEISKETDVKVEVLNNTFAIFTLAIKDMAGLQKYRQINYVEIPKKLLVAKKNYDIYEEYYQQKYICDLSNIGLTGKGILVAILDTGINYKHKDFRNPDGTTRIDYIWDQTVGNNPPEGFFEGTVYTSAEINKALETNQNLGTYDTMGHGTMVAGICVGNGLESDGKYKGVAPDASILSVKLGKSGFESYAMTTEFMRAIKFSYDIALKENKPLVLNTSYGTNAGSHNGSSLFEEYIDDMVSSYPSSFAIASGNEGASGHHYETTLMDMEVDKVEFTIAGGLKECYFSIWKNFVDDISIEIITPQGETTNKIYANDAVQRFNFTNCIVSIVFLSPTPYKIEQEIYVQIDFTTVPTDIEDWVLNLHCDTIVDGELNIWLPTEAEVTNSTRFKDASLNTTLTIPSTASSVITVAGYNSYDDTIALFSGRGFKVTEDKKPNITAPAVDVLTTSNLLGYDTNTGTSFASPFVAGACALFMEYGIVNKNDVFLYGEKLKAYLEKGARRDENLVYPNREFGYGLLCIENTLSLLETQKQLETGVSDNISTSTINEFKELIVENTPSVIEAIKNLPFIDFSKVDINNFEKFIILNVPVQYYDEAIKALSNVSKVEKAVPLGTLGQSALSSMGVKKVHNTPYIGLTGNGVLIGIIDTGIDVKSKSFINKNGKTKIKYLWDMSQNSHHTKFSEGTEFTEEDINAQLENKYDNIDVVTDENGHGTMISSIACSSPVDDYVGVAPNASIICVKLKPCCHNFRQDHLIDSDEEVYKSTDVLKAINYVIEKSLLLNMPISIGICLGAPSGFHDRQSFFESYISEKSMLNGVCISIASGNEQSQRHHAKNIIKSNSSSEISVNVPKDDMSFPIYLQSNIMKNIALSIKSPLGEEIQLAFPKETTIQTHSFILDKTTLYLDFDYSEKMFLLKFKNAVSGIWSIKMFSRSKYEKLVHCYLPISNFVDDDIFFLSSDSYNTVTVPSTADNVISVGGYNHHKNDTCCNSSFGPTTSLRLKPSIVAPAVNIPYISDETPMISDGTSTATAHVIGICALILEWGIKEKNCTNMNTVSINKIICKNAKRLPNYKYPNNVEGYGRISLDTIFE